MGWSSWPPNLNHCNGATNGPRSSRMFEVENGNSTMEQLYLWRLRYLRLVHSSRWKGHTPYTSPTKAISSVGSILLPSHWRAHCSWVIRFTCYSQNHDMLSNGQRKWRVEHLEKRLQASLLTKLPTHEDPLRHGHLRWHILQGFMYGLWGDTVLYILWHV